MSNQFCVIFDFISPKSAKFTCEIPQIAVSKLISKNFTCSAVNIVGIIANFDHGLL